jgi:hypothetical protein
MTERGTIPKSNSFTSVTDVLLIHSSDGATPDVKAPQQPQSPMSESSSRSDTNHNNDAATSKSVRFGLIDQRIYNRIVGDHPDVKVGPPITFSWEYGVLPSTPIDEYEQQKQRSSTSSSTVSRQYQPSYYGLRRLSSITRKNMLRTLFEVSEDEILAAEREVQLIQKQRERSASQSTASAVVESNFRRAGRKVRKSVGKVLMAIATLPLPSYAVSSY